MSCDAGLSACQTCTTHCMPLQTDRSTLHAKDNMLTDAHSCLNIFCEFVRACNAALFILHTTYQHRSRFILTVCNSTALQGYTLASKSVHGRFIIELSIDRVGLAGDTKLCVKACFEHYSQTDTCESRVTQRMLSPKHQTCYS